MNFYSWSQFWFFFFTAQLDNGRFLFASFCTQSWHCAKWICETPAHFQYHNSLTENYMKNKKKTCFYYCVRLCPEQCFGVFLAHFLSWERMDGQKHLWIFQIWSKRGNKGLWCLFDSDTFSLVFFYTSHFLFISFGCIFFAYFSMTSPFFRQVNYLQSNLLRNLLQIF